MSDFIERTLEKVANIGMGQSPPSSSYSDQERGLPFLQGCSEFGNKHPHAVVYCDSPTRIAPKDAILISVRAPVGALNIADREFCIGRGLGFVEGRSALTKYLYYLLTMLRPHLESRGQGSTFEAINTSDLKNLLLELPTPLEQRKIARILTTVDNLIEKTEALIAKYQAVKQGMVHDLFTRGVDARGHLRPTCEEAPELYKESELGWIPKEWEYRSIDSIALRVGSGITPTGGSEVYVTEGVIFIRSQNIMLDGINLSDAAYISEKTHQQMAVSEVFPFDVLLNITGASIGRCCYLPDGLGPTNTNQHVCCIRIKKPNEVDAKFLSSVLSSPIGQNQIFRLNAGGNREGLNYQQLRSFVVPWPRGKERKLIATRLISIETRIQVEKQMFKKCYLLKTGLMQDLLTGKVRVNIDKPGEAAA